MKRKTKYVFPILLAAALVMSYCTQVGSVDNKDEGVIEFQNGLFVNTNVAPETSEKVLTWISSAKPGFLNDLKKNKLIEFDFENLSIAQIHGQDGAAVVVKQSDFDEDNPINYSLSFFEHGQHNIVGAMVIVVETTDEIRTISYFSLKNELISKVEIDLNGVVKQVNTILPEEEFFDNKLKESCGQATADCLADAYANHGWASVWAIVQTAFLPETAAALAIACAAKNCLD